MSEAIEPLGFYVLVEMIEIENTSKEGIYLGDVRKEQDACDIGTVVSFGNTAFNGMPGCNPSEYPPSHQNYSMKPHQIWGIDVGDKVEYRRHEGKISGIKGCSKLRYIPDTQIIGRVA